MIKSFPATNPDLAKDRADIPAWWQSTLDERDALLTSRVKKGEVITYGASAGGRPLRAVAYGKVRTGRGTTTANGAISFGDIRAWLGPDHGKRVALVFSAIHGGEFEGIVGTMNLLAVLETGADLAGRPQPALAAAATRLDRLIVIPVSNPDGRARIPLRMLRFYGASNRAAEYFNTGAWADGSLIGWPANKEFVPVDYARTARPVRPRAPRPRAESPHRRGARQLLHGHASPRDRPHARSRVERPLPPEAHRTRRRRTPQHR